MNLLSCLDFSKDIDIDRSSVRDLILSIDRSYFRIDPRGSKISYEARYQTHHFHQLVQKNSSLSLILSYFYSDDWLNTIFPYIYRSKFGYPPLQNKTSLSRVNLHSPLPSNLAPYITTCKRPSDLDSRDSLFIFPNIQFSILFPGTSIPIHLDRSDKIASLMIYLPDSLQENHPQLGTSFWFPKSPDFALPLSYLADTYRFFDPNEETYIRDNCIEFPIPFSSSCAFLFSSNNRSLHSISYPSNVNLGPRVSININYYACQ